MDWDVLIYILIPIIWAIANFSKSNKKAKEAKRKQQQAAQNANPQTQNTQGKKENDFESLVSEFFGIDDKQAYQEDTYQEIREPIETKQEVEEKDLKEEKDVRKETVTKPVSYFMENDDESHDFSDFDLRKAIIYNAILERPYS